MYLITIIPEVVLDPSFDIDINGSFDFFVGRLLVQPASYRIRRFSLKLPSIDLNPSQYNLVKDCLRNVLKRGVLDLEFDINVKGNHYPLPFELFTCKTLVNMRLGSGFVIDIIPNNALLPALKTLVLDSLRFYDLDGCAFTRLLSACPVLEELVIDRLNWEYWKWSRIVSSLTLKRLTIRRNGTKPWEDYEPSDSETLSLDVPNLAYFEYTDVLQDEYPVVNLNSLVEAKLNLPTMYDIDSNNDLTNLIQGLKDVQILSLGFVDTVVLFHDPFSKILPVFENMSHLSISTEPEFCWKTHQILLKKCPNLKTLTIEDLHYTDQSEQDLESVCECLLGYSFLLSCPIEVLKITKFNGYIEEIAQIKHILEKLLCLELLEVHVQERRNEKKLQIMVDLLMMPRTSTKCKVQVNFS